MKQDKRALLYLVPQTRFYPVRSAADIEQLLDQCEEGALATLKRKLKLSEWLQPALPQQRVLQM